MQNEQSKIGNPLVAAEVAKQASTTIPFLIKTGVIVVVGVVGYRFISTRFVKKSEVRNYPASNITLAQAKTKAASIYRATNYIHTDFETIMNQFSGVNYNGLVRIYNAFGQVGNLATGYSDMDQFLTARLSDTDLLQLRFLTSGAWFKNAQVGPVKSNFLLEPTKPVQEVQPLLKFTGV